MINILIVDDHLIVREGIKRIIDDVSDMNIISEASSGQEAIDLIHKNLCKLFTHTHSQICMRMETKSKHKITYKHSFTQAC